MPIQEAYREEALSKLENLCQAIIPKVEELLEEIDQEDLEFGVKLELKTLDIEKLWKEGIEENNYMEIVFTEIMEHHDGAYLKTTFRNKTNSCYAERYVSIRSSGRVEFTYALFLERDGLKIRVEKVGEGLYSLYVKTQ